MNTSSSSRTPSGNRKHPSSGAPHHRGGGNHRSNKRSPDRVWSPAEGLDNVPKSGAGVCLFVNQNGVAVPRLSFVLMYGNPDSLKPGGSHIHVSAHYTVKDGEAQFSPGDYNLQGLRDTVSLLSMVREPGSQTAFFGQPFDNGTSMVVVEVRDLGAAGRQFRVGLGTKAGLERCVAENWIPVEALDQALAVLTEASEEFPRFFDDHILARSKASGKPTATAV